jgi:hypothetical protein
MLSDTMKPSGTRYRTRKLLLANITPCESATTLSTIPSAQA